MAQKNVIIIINFGNILEMQTVTSAATVKNLFFRHFSYENHYRTHSIYISLPLYELGNKSHKYKQKLYLDYIPLLLCTLMKPIRVMSCVFYTHTHNNYK